MLAFARRHVHYGFRHALVEGVADVDDYLLDAERRYDGVEALYYLVDALLCLFIAGAFVGVAEVIGDRKQFEYGFRLAVGIRLGDRRLVAFAEIIVLGRDRIPFALVIFGSGERSFKLIGFLCGSGLIGAFCRRGLLFGDGRLHKLFLVAVLKFVLVF